MTKGSRKRAANVLRLEGAFRSGSGHVVIIGADRGEAVGLVMSVLSRIDALAVLHIAAATTEEEATNRQSAPICPTLRLRGLTPLLLEQARDVKRPVFVVVDAIDVTASEVLERIRMAAECAPDAIEWMRIVLIGDETLDETLAQPGATALASRICARVCLSARENVEPEAPSASSMRRVRTVSLALLAVAVTALAVRAYIPATSEEPSLVVAESATPQIRQARQAQQDQRSRQGDVESATAPQRSPETSVDAHASREATRDATKTADTQKTAATMAHALAGESASPRPVVAPAESPESVAASQPGPVLVGETIYARDGRALADTIEIIRDESEVRAAMRLTPADAATADSEGVDRNDTSPDRATTDAPAQPAAIADPAPTRTSATKVRTERPAIKETRTAPAVKPTRSRSSKPAEATDKPAEGTAARSVVVQAGEFKDPRGATAIQRKLSTQLDHVLVARLDPPEGTVYSVRVVGLESPAEVATAETVIRKVGLRPVRISKPVESQSDPPSFWRRLLGRRDPAPADRPANARN